MRPHRRALFLAEHSPGGGDCDGYWCQTPPPIPSYPDFGPAAAGPSPSLPPPWGWGLPPCPTLHPPSPAPAHNGRRDQGGGMQGYGPPPPGVGGDHDRRHFVKYVLIAAGVIAFVSLILLGVSVAVRRRQVRRRRQALLAPSINAGAADGDGGGGGGHDHGWGGGGGVVHHVWNIRTVGLDEASISSIAVTRYRAGAGLLGAADCSVCLGEFQDGELVRLLPKCAHAFHVPCIDTWLRAHVNCPICRSDVLDPAVAADSGGGSESVGSSSSPPADPDAIASAAADQAGAASDAAPDHEEEESDGQGASPAEGDQQEQSSSAEPPPPPPPEQLCPLPRNVRRAASMDAVVASTAADVAELDRLPEEAPEEEQIGGRRKRWTGPSRTKASGSGHWSNLSTDRLAPGGVPRSFFSRHCRARSSVLPL